jgi:hypothetical protein
MAPIHPATAATKTLKESRQMLMLMFISGIHKNLSALPSVINGSNDKVKAAVTNPRIRAYAVLALEPIFSTR